MQSSELLELTASEPLSAKEEYENMNSWREDDKKMTFIILDRSIGANYMAGDVNLHILDQNDEGNQTAEVEVMIATARSRRKGLAKDAVLMMMAYAIHNLPIHQFVAKILEQNEPSIHLFSVSLGFQEQRRVRAFGEIHYTLDVSHELRDKLAKTRDTWKVLSFERSPYSKEPIEADDPAPISVG